MGAGPLANGAPLTYIWTRYRLPLAMAETLTRVADAIATRTAPHPLTLRAIARKVAEAHRVACLAAYRVDPRLSAADAHNAAQYAAAMEAGRAFRRAHAAVQLAAANGADADAMHAAAVDAVAELAAFDAAFASR